MAVMRAKTVLGWSGGEVVSANEARAAGVAGRRRCAGPGAVLLGALLSGASALIPIAQAAETVRAAETGPVHLRFAWEPGMSARVETTKTRVRIAETREERTATSAYTIVIDAAGEALRVRSVDPTFDLDTDEAAVAGAPGPSPERLAVIGQIAELMPDFLVNRSGGFLAVHDLDSFRTRLETVFRELLGPGADFPAVAQLISVLASEDYVTQRAAEQWNAIVGFWVDEQLEAGVVRSHSAREPVSMLPGQELLLHYEFEALRAVACERNGAPRGCVELELRSSADAVDTQRVLAAFMAELPDGETEGMPVFETLDMSNVVRLVTEEDGLLPHRLEITRSFDAVLGFAGGQRQSIRQEEISRTRFDYTL